MQGTLLLLGICTFVMNFAHTSPFKHLLPPNSELWTDPGHFFTAWIRVMQLHERERNKSVGEERRAKLDDVMKRRQYQKVHGLDKEAWINNVFGSSAKKDEPALEEENAVATAAPESHVASENVEPETKPRKRFGIF